MVTSAAEREKKFREDLKALLEKHGAELNITDDGSPWGGHRGVATITMVSVWDDNCDITAEYTEYEILPNGE